MSDNDSSQRSEGLPSDDEVPITSSPVTGKLKGDAAMDFSGVDEPVRAGELRDVEIAEVPEGSSVIEESLDEFSECSAVNTAHPRVDLGAGVSFGRKVMIHRALRGLNQVGLASKCDADQSEISRIERDSTKVSRATMMRVARFLDLVADLPAPKVEKPEQIADTRKKASERAGQEVLQPIVNVVEEPVEA
jgi:transcriptional regulator with XRE-family HTH domain